MYKQHDMKQTQWSRWCLLWHDKYLCNLIYTIESHLIGTKKAHMHASMCMWVYVRICMYVCAYIHWELWKPQAMGKLMITSSTSVLQQPHCKFESHMVLALIGNVSVILAPSLCPRISYGASSCRSVPFALLFKLWGLEELS